MRQSVFAARLREARLVAGLSQTALSIKAGLTRCAVHKIEHEGRTCVLETGKALADALGVSLESLIAHSETLPQSPAPVERALEQTGGVA